MAIDRCHIKAGYMRRRAWAWPETLWEVRFYRSWGLSSVSLVCMLGTRRLFSPISTGAPVSFPRWLFCCWQEKSWKQLPGLCLSLLLPLTSIWHHSCCLYCSKDAKPVFPQLPLHGISAIAEGNHRGLPVHLSDICASIQIEAFLPCRHMKRLTSSLFQLSEWRASTNAGAHTPPTQSLSHGRGGTGL